MEKVVKGGDPSSVMWIIDLRKRMHNTHITTTIMMHVIIISITWIDVDSMNPETDHDGGGKLWVFLLHSCSNLGLEYF